MKTDYISRQNQIKPYTDLLNNHWRISWVLGAVRAPPQYPPQLRGRGKEGFFYCRRGGLPRRGPGAAARGAGPRWGLRLSTDTAFGMPPMSMTKCLEPGTLTR